MMASSLPIIDLSAFSSLDELASSLMIAGQDQGFFYVTGHGIAVRHIDALFNISKSFFTDTTQDEKMRFCNGSGDLVSFT